MTRACLFLGDRDVELRDPVERECAPGEIAITLTSSGVCGTDVHYWKESAEQRGDRRSVVPGHEVVGVVESRGTGVDRIDVGTRVVVGQLHIGCNSCAACARGWPVHCARKQVLGRTLDGSYGPRVVVPAHAAYELPDSVSDVDATLLACNAATAFSALSKLERRPCDWLVVTGLGGVGLSAVILARELGWNVVGLDVVADRCRKARSVGAHHAFDVADMTAREVDRTVRDHLGTDFRAAALLECSGAERARTAGISLLGPRGQCVVIAMGGTYRIDADRIIGDQLRILGSAVCRPAEFHDLMTLVTDRGLSFEALAGPRMEIDDVRAALELMDEPSTAGKVVFDWAS